MDNEPNTDSSEDCLLMMKVMALCSHVLYFVVFTDQCSAYSLCSRLS